MHSVSLVSRAILLIFAFMFSFPGGNAMAQGRSVDDAAAYLDYRGYSAYREIQAPQTAQGSAPRWSPSYNRFTTRPIIPDEDEKGNNQDKDFVIMTDTLTGQMIPVAVEDTSSKVEKFYRERTKDAKLSQFGYDLFYSVPAGDSDFTHTIPTGAVQSNYILQVGDEITVTLTGEARSQSRYKISSNGRVFINGLDPINAMGRPLGDVQSDIAAQFARSNYRGEVIVTVDAIRQIGVMVTGHVERPGRHNLNAFHSVIDVLNIAGGIKKSGSLRNIKLIRQGGDKVIDLYDILVFHRQGNDLTLRDGDHIIVPPVGATIAVIGDVKQPAIFELKTSNLKSSTPVPLGQALRMGGGTLGQGDYKFSLIRGNGRIYNLDRKKMTMIDDGSVLQVMRSTDRVQNGIELLGHSRRNGTYDLNSAGTLSALFKKGQVFKDDMYPLIGVIARVDRKRLIQNMMAFSPQAVVLQGDDRQLESGDKIYLFSYDDIHDIINKVETDADVLPKQVADFVRDQGVSVQGAVHAPASWPVGTVTDLETLISVAGGLTTQANRTDIEVTTKTADLGQVHRRQKIAAKDLRLSNLMIQSGDQVRVNEQFQQAVEQTVQITGEVKYPGKYDLMRGDTLLSLIDRAGGLTQDAYPPAAVFSRAADRKREELKFKAAAQELERTVSASMNAKNKDAPLTPAQISMAQKLASDLRAVKAVGRVTVEADPSVLELRPELNMLLDDGDHLHIPKRTVSVRVAGEVMNPASLLFENTKDPTDYIREAGGTTYFADKGRGFVLYPDGSAQPLKQTGWQSHERAMVIPGSTIVIPRDPKPFDFMESFKDITQILSNMAITGVFIEDIANDEN